MSEDNTNEDVVEEAVEAAVSDAAAQVAKVNIGLQDLVICANIIDLATLHNSTYTYSVNH